ncbi:hypothetical protein LSPH24S_00374 [Lysinibacillus sphaericus]
MQRGPGGGGSAAVRRGRRCAAGVGPPAKDRTTVARSRPRALPSHASPGPRRLRCARRGAARDRRVRAVAVLRGAARADGRRAGREPGGRGDHDQRGADARGPSGQLRMTTIEATGPDASIHLGDVLGSWFDTDRAVMPRDAVYPSGDDVKRDRAVQPGAR